MMRHALLAIATAGTLLVGCDASSTDTAAPLAHVPADTPYLFASLERPDDATLDATLAAADLQIEAHRQQLAQLAETLRDNDAAPLARILDVIAAELAGKTGYRQVAESIGIDLHGLSAFYGLGLTPVLRLTVADAQRYQDFLDRLAEAAGTAFETRDLDGTDYRRVPLKDAPLQLISAIDGEQAVLALAPETLDDTTLAELLGESLPEKSSSASGRLARLADAKGYLPYGTGYVDTRRLVALITGGDDPLAGAFETMREHATGRAPEAMSAACRQDAGRIAGWVPQLSLGYTAIETDHIAQRLDVALNEDIAKPFAELRSPLPGLGADGDAPFDLAVALPMPTLRKVLREQLDSMQATPFTCPALADLNTDLGRLGQRVNMLAVPPLGDLRGLRLVLDALAPARDTGVPHIEGAALLATSNPEGLLAMGQAMIPGLAELRLAPDARPTSLPTQWRAMLNGEPGWAAMSDRALGVAVGDDEQARLRALMQGEDAAAGHLLHLKFSGAMYLTWLQATQTFVEMQGDSAAADELQAQIDASRAQFEHIDTLGVDVRIADSGLVVEGRVDWQE